jgi:hypothetical protein
MRSKTIQRILENTPKEYMEEIQKKVDDYVDKLLSKKKKKQKGPN